MIEAKWNPEITIPAHYSILIAGNLLTQYPSQIKQLFEQHTSMSFDKIKYIDHGSAYEYAINATLLKIEDFDALCRDLTKLANTR